jgi:hypothetical protein
MVFHADPLTFRIGLGELEDTKPPPAVDQVVRVPVAEEGRGSPHAEEGRVPLNPL